MTNQQQSIIAAAAAASRSKRPVKLTVGGYGMPAFGRFDHASAVVRDALGIARLNREQAAEIRTAVARHQERQEGRIGLWQPAPDALATRRPGHYARLLQQRLEGTVTAHVLALYRRATGSWAGGNTTVRVALSDTPEAYGRSERAWSANGKWRGLDAALFVTVSPRWRSQVAGVDGLATAGGLLTTHAESIEDGAWAATWIEQGRGFDIKAVSGIILRASDGTFVHAKTLAAARKVARLRTDLDALARRAQITNERAEARHQQRAAILSTPTADLIDAYGSVVVTASDSKRAGNCDAGTRSWIERHMPGRTEATVAELLAADPDNVYLLRGICAAILRAGEGARVAC